MMRELVWQILHRRKNPLVVDMVLGIWQGAEGTDIVRGEPVCTIPGHEAQLNPLQIRPTNLGTDVAGDFENYKKGGHFRIG